MPLPKEIKPEEYISHLTNGERDQSRVLMMLEKAYQTALDTRKFEIELYWKRATYFWAFIAAIFIAIYSILNGKDFSLNREVSDIDFLRKVLIILLSFLGYLFSLGWFFVNRGSKVWQKNWETHIDLLENTITGPLFKTVIKPNLKFGNLNSYFPYSVSKVNQTLSLFVAIFWIILIFILYYILVLQDLKIWCCLIFIIILALFLILISYILHIQSLSFMYKHWKGKGGYKSVYINID